MAGFITVKTSAGVLGTWPDFYRAMTGITSVTARTATSFTLNFGDAVISANDAANVLFGLGGDDTLVGEGGDHLKEPLGSRPFAEIERKDVREIRDQVLERAGPIQSSRVVALSNRVMNWAVDEDRAKFNPAAQESRRRAAARAHPYTGRASPRVARARHPTCCGP